MTLLKIDRLQKRTIYLDQLSDKNDNISYRVTADEKILGHFVCLLDAVIKVNKSL